MDALPASLPDSSDENGTGAGTGATMRGLGPSRRLVFAACAAAALTGGAGIAGIAAILSASYPQQTAAETRELPDAVAGACGECGVIESIRMTEHPRQDGLPVTSNGRYETSIRMHDGSSLVIVDSMPRAWRFGDRVKVIGGVI